MSKEKVIPLDGEDAFYEGCEPEDNPYPDNSPRYLEWYFDLLEAAKEYRESGRFRDGSFKG